MKLFVDHVFSKEYINKKINYFNSGSTVISAENFPDEYDSSKVTSFVEIATGNFKQITLFKSDK